MLSPETLQTVATIKQGRSRAFTCTACGRETTVLRLTGRLPDKCIDCDPNRAVWARERSERQLRAAILELEAEVCDLRDLIGADEDALARSRARRFGPPGKLAIKRAVTVLASSRGQRETADALLDLAACAQAWAQQLAGPAIDVEMSA